MQICTQPHALQLQVPMLVGVQMLQLLPLQELSHAYPLPPLLLVPLLLRQRLV